MIRLLLPLILLVLLPLSGCISTLQEAGKTSHQDPDLQLFVEGIDHFDAGRRTAAFAELEQRYPNSPWMRRSRILASLAGSVRLLEKQVKRQQTLIEGHQKDRQALADLKHENDLLREQVQVLKALVVDLELRQP